jgi:hypothetical protein
MKTYQLLKPYEHPLSFCKWEWRYGVDHKQLQKLAKNVLRTLRAEKVFGTTWNKFTFQIRSEKKVDSKTFWLLISLYHKPNGCETEPCYILLPLKEPWTLTTREIVNVITLRLLAPG